MTKLPVNLTSAFLSLSLSLSSSDPGLFLFNHRRLLSIYFLSSREQGFGISFGITLPVLIDAEN